MNRKIKKYFALVLSLVMALSINVTAFAQETTSTPETYQIMIGDEVVEVEEGSYVEIPMESLMPQTRASSDTVVGDAGTLTVWGSGHYVYWSIVMTVPATSFVGTVSVMDISSGLSAGSPAIAGFSGSVYAARISGHQYTATLDGIAYNGTTAVARTLSNRITWTP